MVIVPLCGNGIGEDGGDFGVGEGETGAGGMPEIAGHERVDEAQLEENMRRDALGRPAAWAAEPMRLPP